MKAIRKRRTNTELVAFCGQSRSFVITCGKISSGKRMLSMLSGLSQENMSAQFGWSLIKTAGSFRRLRRLLNIVEEVMPGSSCLLCWITCAAKKFIHTFQKAI